jgi:hypothetical protein
MRSICYLLLISAMPLLKVEASLAQELSVEDRACITGAVAKLPQVAALKIEGSRAIEGRVLEQPQSQGLRKWNVYRVKVESFFALREGLPNKVGEVLKRTGSHWLSSALQFHSCASRAPR